MSSAPLKLSVVTITLNNERTLDRMLSAVSGWADEIVIVDSGSTDRTLEIAYRHNCSVYHRDFDGFGMQKRSAVEHAAHDWVMVVDADEILTGELKEEIRLTLQDTSCVGFTVPISLIFMDRLMRYGREYKMPHLRLFNRKYGNYNTVKVHEDVLLKGKTGKLYHHMLHYSYANLHEYFAKFNNYTTSAARDLARTGKKKSGWALFCRFPFQFTQDFIFRLNFLNGYPGFIWSLCSAFYPIVKYAKLKEISETHN